MLPCARSCCSAPRGRFRRPWPLGATNGCSSCRPLRRRPHPHRRRRRLHPRRRPPNSTSNRANGRTSSRAISMTSSRRQRLDSTHKVLTRGRGRWTRNTGGPGMTARERVSIGIALRRMAASPSCRHLHRRLWQPPLPPHVLCLPPRGGHAGHTISSSRTGTAPRWAVRRRRTTWWGRGPPCWSTRLCGALGRAWACCSTQSRQPHKGCCKSSAAPCLAGYRA
jgi:hypothetical protein